MWPRLRRLPQKKKTEVIANLEILWVDSQGLGRC